MTKFKTFKLIIMGILLVICMFAFSKYMIVGESKKSVSQINTKSTKEDFILANVSTGLDANQVRQLLGSPIDIKTFSTNSDLEIWEYEGLKITFTINYVVKIAITSSKYSTYRGIKVGDNVLEIEKKYKNIFKLNDRQTYIFSNTVHATNDDGQKVFIEFNLGFHYNDLNKIDEIWITSAAL